MCLCACDCMCLCVRVSMCLCVYVGGWLSACVRVCMCVYVCACVRVFVFMCVRLCVSVCVLQCVWSTSLQLPCFRKLGVLSNKSPSGMLQFGICCGDWPSFSLVLIYAARAGILPEVRALGRRKKVISGRRFQGGVREVANSNRCLFLFSWRILLHEPLSLEFHLRHEGKISW